VKVRGFRLELGEIEAQLRSMSGVADAVVTARQAPEGERRLVGYYVCHTGATIGAQQLKEQLSARLPGYMVPTALMELPQLPLTRNGKLDHGALPEPERHALLEEPYEQPRGALEQAVAKIWQELLQVAQVGRRDNFFELGGNSLLIMRLAARVHQVLGRKVQLNAWLENPVLAALAEQLEASAIDAPALEIITADREHEHEPFPLTPLQLAYWLGRNAGLELGNIGSHVYLELRVVEVDVVRFEHALNRLIARHGMLRMVITAQGKQRILPHVPRYVVRVNDWRDTRGEVQQQLQAVRAEMSHQVFSGDAWPLFDFRVSLLGARAIIHISVDALTLDASSGLIVREELRALYAEPQRELPSLELSFRDYVLARQRLEGSSLYQQARRYWLERLPSFPPAPDLPLACDPARIVAPHFEQRSHRLAARHWRALLSGAQRHRVTPTVLFLTCLGELLSRWTQQSRFALNLTLFNRLPIHAHVDRLLGDFSTLTLLEMDFGTALSFAERLRATRQQLWSDLEQRHFDGVEVIQALRQARDQVVRYPVVVTSTLGLPQHASVGGASEGVPGAVLVAAGEEYSISQTPQVWLDVQVFEHADGIVYNWDSVVGLFPAGMLDAMFAAFSTLLEQLAEASSRWTQPVQIELPASQRQLIAAANASVRAGAPGLLHGPLLEQIATRPDQVAVRAAARVLSYAQLGQRSVWLAWQLSQGGARRNQPIAIVMEKGWQQIVAVLGILRAGAPYVAIDASWPAERIALLLSNVAVEQVVTTARHASSVPTQYRRHVIGDALEGAQGTVAPQVDLRPDDLAYVIFTSGSTGVPKGVMIEHGAALNTVLDINERYAVGAEDGVLGLSNLSFDLSVYDIFGVLGAGGTLILPRPEEYRDPSAWLQYLQPDAHGAGVTVWNTVPALAGLAWRAAIGRMSRRRRAASFATRTPAHACTARVIVGDCCRMGTSSSWGVRISRSRSKATVSSWVRSKRA
jgi:non-ribosomal peptide synthetase component F